MVNEQQLGDALSRELHELVRELSPRPDLADHVIRRRRDGRRRGRVAGVGAGIVAIAAAVVVTLGSSGTPGSTQLGSAHLRLASYTFRLPRGAHAVSATPAACAVGAAVVYIPDPGEGVSNPDQPAIAKAVTANGGCVSMLLTDPYTSGAANAPKEPNYPVDQQQVQIGSYTGTIGTYAIIGADMTFHGVPVPSGTRQTVLNLTLPTSGGQVQDLQVAAAGITEQQLVSIVSSGLTPQQSGSTTPATSK